MSIVLKKGRTDKLGLKEGMMIMQPTFKKKFHWFLQKILISYLLPTRNYARNWTHNLSIHPNLELNRWPFGVWDDTQPAKPHQLGLHPLLELLWK